MVDRTNAISARISDDAYSVYRQFKERREGGAMISDAILFYEGKDRALEYEAKRTRNILALQSRLTKALEELAQVAPPDNPPN